MRLPHPGALVALAIVLMVSSGFGGLFSAADARSSLLAVGPYLTRVLGFSLAQAALSTMGALMLGAALALALARRRFPGRHLVIGALGAASVMPAIVVVFAVIAVYGRSGWLAEGMRLLGLDPAFRIFGWPGILLAHVFLNAPFVARVYLDALAAVPTEQWRLAEVLGFGPRQIARHIDWPVLRSELASLAGLVFLLCFTSFAIVLNLGGPGRATLEVAIFEALKADLDFSRAAWLGLVQVAVCVGVAIALHRTVTRSPASHTTRLAIARADGAAVAVRVADIIVLVVATLVVLPILVAVLSGLPHLPAILDQDLAQALATSLALATLSALAACLMALALATASRRDRLVRKRPVFAMAYDFIPATVLAVPPFALTAGLFLLVRQAVEPTAAGYLLLPLVNALGALPFAYRFIAPPLATAGERYGRPADLLGLQGLVRLWIVDWPLLRRPLAGAFAMAMALSFGDFGIVALFGGGDLRTLPYLLYERLGAYRLEEASAVGLILVAIAFTLASASSRLADAPR